MDRNESIIAIPPSVDDPVILRRVLSKIVESLDIAIGNRDSDSEEYVTQKAFDKSVVPLEKAVATALASLSSSVSKLPLDQQTLSDLSIAAGKNKTDIADLTTTVDNQATAITNAEGRLDDLEAEPATDRMKWLGAWTAGAYTKNDVVKDAGITWIALAATSGVPGVSVDWESLV